jgi:tRNA threonylcarbamoyladenosine biosynthesis protein TsaE
MVRPILENPFFLPTLKDTECLGSELSKGLKKNDLIAFFGEVGAGKTTLIKSIVAGLGFSKNEITSPTFTYMNIYEGTIPIFHFDLYRLNNENDFLEKGFDEYFYNEGICLIEWAEKIPCLLPEHTKKIYLSHLPEGGRLCKIQ